MITIRLDDSSEHCTDQSLIEIALIGRMKRAAKAFVVLFMLAVFSILIPILHFILVPLFLILSFVVSYRRMYQRGYIELKRFNCPRCKAAMGDEAMYINSEKSVRIYCYTCRSDLRLVFNEKF